MLRSMRRLASTFSGPRQRGIEQRLTEVFAPTHLEVLNESHGRKEDESHFKVVVVSDVFEDYKGLMSRHRALTKVLLDEEGPLLGHEGGPAASDAELLLLHREGLVEISRALGSGLKAKYWTSEVFNAPPSDSD